MKKIIFIYTLLTLVISQSTFANASIARGVQHNLPLDLSSEEYTKLLTQLRPFELENNLNSERQDLDKILTIGKRNLEWLKFINSNKSNPNDPNISFSSPETQTGYPIEQPSIYNGQLIIERFKKVVSDLPAEMKSVLIDNKPFTANLNISRSEYIQHGLSVDRSYQITARWLLLKPYLSYLISNKYNDIRGYYFFSSLNSADLKNLFSNFKTLPPELQIKVRESLWSLCINSEIEKKECDKQIDSELQNFGHLENYYSNQFNQHMKVSKGIYNVFFNIPYEVRRSDVQWILNPVEKTTVPFLIVDNSEIQQFLKINIEDEWRYNNWHLNLDFTPNADVHVEFEEGVTPHVNGLGGNTITMDANAPLTEYDVQWTIRHEFGHVLGFPDCYLEFYDEDKKAIIGYQIDTSDLMCSRKGHIKQRHFDELKKIYNSSIQ